MVRTIRDDEGEKQEKAQFLTLYTHQSGAFFFPLLTVKSRTTNRNPKHLSHFSFPQDTSLKRDCIPAEVRAELFAAGPLSCDSYWLL